MLQPFGRFLKKLVLERLGIGTEPDSNTALHVKRSGAAFGMVWLENPDTNGEASVGYRDSSDDNAHTWVAGKNISTTDDSFTWYYNGTWMGLMPDGRFFLTAAHNNANSIGGTSRQYFGSGSSTTLTVAAVTNVSAVAFRRMQWARDGNFVWGSGAVNITPTAAGFCDVAIDLPLALSGNFADAYQCAGTTFAAGQRVAGYVTVVSSNKMDVNFVATGNTATEVFFTFGYELT